MDLRFVAVLMAIAIIMDMLGRMAKKRAIEQQGQGLPGHDPDQDQDLLTALSEARGPARGVEGEARPVRREQVMGGFELWSPAPSAPEEADAFDRRPRPDPVEPERVGEPPMVEPVIRDRAARPIIVRSREPRSVTPRPERAAADDDLAIRARQLPEDRPPDRPLPRRPRHPPPATGSRRTRDAEAGDRLGLRTPGGLRAAIVAREIIGPPRALRGDDERFGGS